MISMFACLRLGHKPINSNKVALPQRVIRTLVYYLPIGCCDSVYCYCCDSVVIVFE